MERALARFPSRAPARFPRRPVSGGRPAQRAGRSGTLQCREAPRGFGIIPICRRLLVYRPRLLGQGYPRDFSPHPPHTTTVEAKAVSQTRVRLCPHLSVSVRLCPYLRPPSRCYTIPSGPRQRSAPQFPFPTRERVGVRSASIIAGPYPRTFNNCILSPHHRPLMPFGGLQPCPSVRRQ